MEIIAILVISILTLVMLLPILKLNLKNIKLIKQIGEDANLNELTNVFPENEEICKDILKMIDNENVNIKITSQDKQAGLYIVATNSILISNTKKSCTRIQTVAHECIHSIQDKTLLWFNFIFSNVYLIYFVMIALLTIFKVIKEPNIYVIILVMISIPLYLVRSYIENDAMIKAKYLAKDYMERKKDLITEDNINLIIDNYEKLNTVGIKFYNWSILAGYLIKIITYCVIAITMKSLIY